MTEKMMAYSLVWLPGVLRAAGLKVAETEGWIDRGRGEMGRVRGVMCHHTGTTAPGNMPTLELLKKGRNDLPGPLAQLGLGRDGTFYVIAAGRANHAGPGMWKGIRTGNSSFIGIEAENGGREGDVWPDVQMDAYRRGVAEILRHIGADASMCCGHKEYRQPRIKLDPLFDMDVFRADVQAIMAGTGKVRPQIPAKDQATGKPTLRRGDRGPDVGLIQTTVKVSVDERFDPKTQAAVRQFQLALGLVGDGVVWPKTWTHIA